MTACCCRLEFSVYALPGSFWTLARRSLLQYIRNLTAAAERGDSAEVSWLLGKEPADFTELQPEAFHCALFAGVLCGHHKTVETILQHQNPEKAVLFLPTCTLMAFTAFGKVIRDSKQPGEPVSFLALAYGWEHYARHYPSYKEEEDKKWPKDLYGPQYLGLMQLLLEYGVRPALGLEGLLQRLSCTLDMAAVAVLQAHQLDIGTCQLPDGRTLLHLLVSSRCLCEHEYQPAMFGPSTAPESYKEVKEWQDEAAPLLQLLLATPGATLQHDRKNKTPMDVCLPEYKQFLSAMKSARLSAQPVQTGNSNSEQRHCVVCKDRYPSVAIIPCGHLCVCQPCSSQLQPQCPVCRGAVTQVLQTYSP